MDLLKIKCSYVDFYVTAEHFSSKKKCIFTLLMRFFYFLKLIVQYRCIMLFFNSQILYKKQMHVIGKSDLFLLYARTFLVILIKNIHSKRNILGVFLGITIHLIFHLFP